MANRVSWGPQAYAGFWRRFGGALIDGVLLWVVWWVLTAMFGPAVLDQPVDPQTLQVAPGYVAALATWSFVFVVLWVAYETIFLSTLGWTLGKRVVGVEVRGRDGALLSVPRAIGRTLGKYVSALPLYLGFMWAGWDPQKQAWHDKFVSSFALKRALLQPAGAPGVGAPSAPGQPLAQPQETVQATQAPYGGGWGIPGQQPPPQPAAQPDRRESDWDRPHAPVEGWDAPDDGGGEPAGADAGPFGIPGGVPARPAPPQPPQPSTPPAASAQPSAGSPPPQPAAEPAPPQERPPQAPSEPAGVDEGLLDFDTPSQPAQQPPPAGAPTEQPPPAGAPAGAAAEEDDWGLGDLDAISSQPGTEPPRTPASEPAAPVPPASQEPDAAGATPAAPGDPNLVAIRQSGIPPASADWLEQVATQVDARLDRVNPQWRSSPQAEAARACAFGLLLGHLGRLYTHMASDLEAVSEGHPSFTTLPAGSRLQTLQEIAGDPGRATAWLGPLVGADEMERIRRLFE